MSGLTKPSERLREYVEPALGEYLRTANGEALVNIARSYAASHSTYIEARRFRSRVKSEFVAVPGLSL
jgi:hypothetical protein